MSADPLQKIEDDAIAAASSANTVEDRSKAVDTLKAIADIRKTARDTANESRTFITSFVQSLAALLVPIVSVAALVGTIYFQAKQLSVTTAATNQQLEDTEWRDLLSSLKGGPDVVYNDVTIAPRLQSFFNSAAYGNQARSIAVRLMGHLVNPDGFNDLFSYIFPVVNSSNIAGVLDVSKALVRTERNVDAPQLAIIRKEQALVSERIVTYIKTYSTVPNLSGTAFVDADLADLTFSDVDIGGTIFDNVNLTGIILKPSRFVGVEFRSSNWWDARELSGPLLAYTIDTSPITRAQYIPKVQALCNTVAITCPSNIPIRR